MDLNLYLGVPRYPTHQSGNLGSDLAFCSLPLSSSSTTVENSRALVPMSGAVEPSDSHPPYSPSHAEYTPDLPSVLPSRGIDPPEYTPDFPSYARYSQSLSPIPASAQESEALDASYSPSSVQPLPPVQESDETAVQDDDTHMLYDPASPPILADEPISYTPPYVSTSPNGQDQEGAAFSFYPSFPLQTTELMCQEDGPSSRPEPIPSPESHTRRLIDAGHRWPNRRFRSSLMHGGDRFSFGSLPVPNSELSGHDTLCSPKPSECSGKHKVVAEDNSAQTSQEKQEKGRSAANFECNICFDMAAEPVVTSCGHLFCWPCLYQWLHLHSDHKECPVCKGEVTESNITPIYGRGSGQPGAQQNNEDEGESGHKIPPRPRGNRFESFRQQFRPVSRRLDEELVASWRRLLDQHMRREHRDVPDADPSLQEIFDNVHRRALSRLRARRVQREVNPGSASSITVEHVLPVNNVSTPIRSNSNSVFRDGVNLLQQISMYDLGTDRLAAISVELGNVVGRFANGSSRYNASTLSDAPNLEPPTTAPRVESALASDQASASSTMAVIQGDIASDTLAETNSAGSSLPNRRRGSSSMPGSCDVDGTLPCKRRLN
ncbi:hypothetical protein Cni_G07760 [Canna indica]|uniref:E3 ubiquitin-protein ligase RMA n=1 Tax=Canna indica TaxID=4628 RepID=A0AAQ3JZA7_9LILI|nr:hypothetical protein Cni_G07760 [Canna indica]